ncbi:hypothetical protein ES705_24904 [subsurface metagenome]
MWNKRPPHFTPSNWRTTLPWLTFGTLVWLGLCHQLASL